LLVTERFIKKQYSDLIKDELAPQFLGLWVKMYQQGVPADIAKRGMAVALFKTCLHLEETRILSDDTEVLNLIKEVREICLKYENNGMHFARISAVLEYLIPEVLGTKSLEDEK